MSESLAPEVEARLDRYLRGADSLAEFEAWLVPESWDLSPQSDPVGHQLAAAITLRIAEFTNGDWSEDELRLRLKKLLPQETITFSGVAKNQKITTLPSQSSSILAGSSR